MPTKQMATATGSLLRFKVMRWLAKQLASGTAEHAGSEEISHMVNVVRKCYKAGLIKRLSFPPCGRKSYMVNVIIRTCYKVGLKILSFPFCDCMQGSAGLHVL
jgi:hypothetical protein